MKMKLKINGKMLFFVLGTTILVFVAAMVYISLTLRNFSTENSQRILQAKTIEIANQTEQKLASYLNVAQVLADAFSQYDKIPEVDRRATLAKILEDILKKNDDFLSVWAICEPNSIDNLDSEFSNQLGSTILGNFRYVYYKQNGEVRLSNYIEQNPTEVFRGKVYTRVKNDPVFTIVEPYYSYNNKDSILQTNLVFPIIKENRFIGVIGIDAPMSKIQKLFSQMKPMEEGRVYILTHEGNFLAHPDSLFLGLSFSAYASDIEHEFHVSEYVLEGKNIHFIADEPQTGSKSMFFLKPLLIGQSKTPWSFGISVPLSKLYEGTNRTFTFALFIGLLGLIIISLIIMGIANSITKPLLKATQQLQLIAKGEIQNIEVVATSPVKDEISDMTEAMYVLTDGLKAATHFAQEIGKGRLDVHYKMLSENDLIGKSLLTMQERLTNAHTEEEKKRIEDEKRNWVTHGLASFGEIIRQHNDNMSKFTFNVTKNLIEYLNAAQGAMYISQQIGSEFNEQVEFELKTAIAYGKQVMLTKTVFSGQELLGRAIEENKTILLEDIPASYVMLSPGMQEKERPRNLLIIPISINDVPLGIFELLSYHRFEPHHIEFIEKLSENIGSVISSVNTTVRTTKLLEQSQEQADILAQHEEEMRQNLEEMQATQEESAKREESLNYHIKGVKSTIMLAELDMEGRIIDLSAPMSIMYGANLENLRGKYYDAIITQDNDSRKEFTEFWAKMVQNGYGKRKQFINLRNKESWLVETYKVIQRDRMLPIVILMAVDRTKEKEMEEMLAAEMRALK
ncbi:MAG: cache domain-containing protein [Salinivirgaceae bacterium]